MSSLQITQTHKSKQRERIYYIDWLRILAVIGVFFTHIGNMFDTLYRPIRGSVSNVGDVINSTLTNPTPVPPASGGIYFLSFFPQWGMSLFFLLSGASTWFALRHRSSRQFLQERCTRLLLPFLISFILIAPFQAYFIARSNTTYTGKLIQFYPLFLESIQASWNPQWICAYAHHLWFLVYLFAITMITLPVCLFLKSSRGRVVTNYLIAISNKQGGLLLFVLPLVLVQMALRASFPGYQGWADIACWVICYLFGYILFSHAHFGQAIQRQGKLAFYVGIIGFLMAVGLWITGFLGPWTTAPDYTVGCLLFQVLASINIWAWMIAVLAFSNRSLNVHNPMLRYGSAASFPFYLLHFPIVVITSYFILPLHTNIIVAFILISVSAFIVTFAFIEILLMSMHYLHKHPISIKSATRVSVSARGTGLL